MYRRSFFRSKGGCVSVLIAVILRAVVLEKQTYAPDSGKCHQHINYPAEKGRCSAEQPCHKVKLKYPDKTPVQSADYEQYQSDFIQHIKPLFSKMLLKNICSGTV